MNNSLDVGTGEYPNPEKITSQGYQLNRVIRSLLGGAALMAASCISAQDDGGLYYDATGACMEKVYTCTDTNTGETYEGPICAEEWANFTSNGSQSYECAPGKVGDYGSYSIDSSWPCAEAEVYCQDGEGENYLGPACGAKWESWTYDKLATKDNFTCAPQ